MNITPEQLAELAKTASITDPINWGEVPIDENLVYSMMAGTVIEMVSGLNDPEKEIVMMAAICKLLVENFVMHVKSDATA